jgi:RNA polymerase sigma-70 factor (family 1)
MDVSNPTGLLKSYNARQERAFDEVFNLYYGPLNYFALKLVQDAQLSEEIVSDAFMNTWKHSIDYNSIEHIKGVLFKTTRNIALNHLKKKKRQNKHFTELTLQIEQEEHIQLVRIEAELLDIIYCAAEKLPTQCKTVFKKMYMEGMDYDEVAEAMQIQTRTVRNQKARAIILIRKILVENKVIMVVLWIV